MKITVESSFLIEDGRIFEILSRAFAIDVIDDGTVCKLLKTSSYKRKQRHVSLLFNRAHQLIENKLTKNNLHWKQWQVIRQGSANYYDIVTQCKQSYKVVKVK